MATNLKEIAAKVVHLRSVLDAAAAIEAAAETLVLHKGDFRTAEGVRVTDRQLKRLLAEDDYERFWVEVRSCAMVPNLDAERDEFGKLAGFLVDAVSMGVSRATPPEKRTRADSRSHHARDLDRALAAIQQGVVTQ